MSHQNPARKFNGVEAIRRSAHVPKIVYFPFVNYPVDPAHRAFHGANGLPTWDATVAKNHDGINPGIVQLWNPSSGDLLLQLDATSTLRVAFSPDGAVLATGSYDRLVGLWNTKNGELLAALGGHSDYVTDLAFSPDGTLLASGSRDGTVLLWGIPDLE